MHPCIHLRTQRNICGHAQTYTHTHMHACMHACMYGSDAYDYKLVDAMPSSWNFLRRCVDVGTVRPCNVSCQGTTPRRKLQKSKPQSLFRRQLYAALQATGQAGCVCLTSRNVPCFAKPSKTWENIAFRQGKKLRDNLVG